VPYLKPILHWTVDANGALVQGNANSSVVHGALVAYDAETVTNGKMKQLFHSDTNPANSMGNFARTEKSKSEHLVIKLSSTDFEGTARISNPLMAP
jgi:hypothetical protein